MRRVVHELRYDGATTDQVHTMLADPAFREAVCDFQQFPRKTVTVIPNGAGMSVTIDQYQNADRVPSFARRIVGNEINIVQTEEWSDASHGDITVTIPGKPGEMSGTAVLNEDAAGVTETVTLAVKVNVPLVGGRIEGFIADLLSKALRAEHKVGRDWLVR